MDKKTELKSIVIPLLNWYHQNARILPWRENHDPYRVWISEIMLQQTRVDTVIPYYERFLKALPDIESLANVPEDELLKLWEGLGYYSRARNLKRAAQKMMTDFGGKFPDRPEQVKTLPGIGPYTTGAICSIAFEQPTPAVDGNVLRVISRITASRDNIDEVAVRQKMTADLAEIYPETERGDFTQSLMELGALVCIPNGAPLCGQCPICNLCRAYQSKTQEQFPVKNGKPERKIQPMTIFLLECDGKLAVCKRDGKGLLAGLWQFPNVDRQLSKSEVKSYLQSLDFEILSIRKLSIKKHIFTHIEWKMSGYEVSVGQCDPNYVWVDRRQLNAEIPLPTAFRKFI